MPFDPRFQFTIPIDINWHLALQAGKLFIEFDQ
jgi:hypothetical protein